MTTAHISTPPTSAHAAGPTVGSLLMVSAPSGAGKSSLVTQLLKDDPAIKLSISYTTRAPRPGEQHGVHYHYVSVDEFKARIEQGEFLEYAHVHGNYYGTSAAWLHQQMQTGHDVLLEIDWQGADQVMRLFKDVVSIFILPPSMQELRHRLTGRGQDSHEVIERRLQAAGHEIAQAKKFEYVIINQDFSVALQELQAIVMSARLRQSNQRVRHSDLFQALGA